jgi:hypothetical protein
MASDSSVYVVAVSYEVVTRGEGRVVCRSWSNIRACGPGRLAVFVCGLVGAPVVSLFEMPRCRVIASFVDSGW